MGSTVRPNLNNFSAGEISPTFYARTDLEVYYKGCKTLKNFAPLPSGAVKKRPGTRFLYNMGTDRGICFFSINWPDVDKTLACLKVEDNTLYNLVYLNLDDLTLGNESESGAYYHNFTNDDFSKRISVVDGEIYVRFLLDGVPTSRVYKTEYVAGSCLTNDQVGAFDTSFTYSVGQNCMSSNHYFESKVDSNTGNTPTIGGDAYWYDRGVDFYSTTASTINPFSSFGIVGYACVGTIFESRTLYGGMNHDTGYPRLCGSMVEDYDVWGETGITSDNEPFQFDFIGGFGKVKWISAKGQVFVGCEHGEFIVSPGITPTNVSVTQISNYGSGDVSCVAGDLILFTGKDNKRIFAIEYNYQSEAYVANDISAAYSHLFTDEIKYIIYQAIPNPTLWCVLMDGSLVCIAFDRSMQVNAAWQFETTGTVESVACVDEYVGMIVKRGNNYIFEYIDYGEPSDAAHNLYLDSAVEEDSPADLTAISGLDHLEGMEVYCFADAMVLGPFTVSGGEIDISSQWEGETVGHIITGLLYEGEIETMPFEFKGGSGLYQEKKVNKATVLLKDTGETITMGTDSTHMATVKVRLPSDNLDEAVPFKSGYAEELIDGKNNREATLIVKSSVPQPCTITAILPEVEVMK